jgi:hypothetical protein
MSRRIEETHGDVSTLITIHIAARRTGFRSLERSVRNRLRDEHGVNLRFIKEKRTKTETEREVADVHD